MLESPETKLLLRVIDQHIGALRDDMEKMKVASEDRHVQVMELIEKGFPDGDLISHRDYHKRLIEDALNRKSIKLEIWKKVLSGSIWSVLVFLAYQALDWIKNVKFQ